MAQIFDIGNRYLQREETVHLAVELIDRVFLNYGNHHATLFKEIFSSDKSTALMSQQEEEEFELTRIKHLSLFTTTCYLIAAKYDELDENIPLASDLQRYYTIKVLPPQIPAPTPDEVIECERYLMQKVFFWDLMSISDSLPTHVVGLLLANGVVFDYEESDKEKAIDLAGRVAERALQFLDILVWERGATQTLRDK
jgi:Cyclin, N-terminal domain